MNRKHFFFLIPIIILAACAGAPKSDNGLEMILFSFYRRLIMDGRNNPNSLCYDSNFV